MTMSYHVWTCMVRGIVGLLDSLMDSKKYDIPMLFIIMCIFQGFTFDINLMPSPFFSLEVATPKLKVHCYKGNKHMACKQHATS